MDSISSGVFMLKLSKKCSFFPLVKVRKNDIADSENSYLIADLSTVGSVLQA
jgi:hypothetical protein